MASAHSTPIRNEFPSRPRRIGNRLSSPVQRTTGLVWLVTGVRHNQGVSARRDLPSTIRNDYWVWAENRNHPDVNPETSGKWQLYVKRDKVDEAWSVVKGLVEDGLLGPGAKVSTARENPNSSSPVDVHVLIIYAADWRDLADLRRILRVLRDAGLAMGWVHFKRDLETRSGAYLNRGNRGVSVWNAAPEGEEIFTKWLTGSRLLVTPENEGDIVARIEAQDSHP